MKRSLFRSFPPSALMMDSPTRMGRNALPLTLTWRLRFGEEVPAIAELDFALTSDAATVPCDFSEHIRVGGLNKVIQCRKRPKRIDAKACASGLTSAPRFIRPKKDDMMGLSYQDFPPTAHRMPGEREREIVGGKTRAEMHSHRRVATIQRHVRGAGAFFRALAIRRAAVLTTSPSKVKSERVRDPTGPE